MPDLYPIRRIELLQATQALINDLFALNSALLADKRLPAHPAWGAKENARERLTRSLTKISYEDGQDPKTINPIPGLILASEAACEQARAVNEAKAAFRDARKALEAVGGDPHRAIREGMGQGRNPDVARTLHLARVPRIQLIQADRRVVVLDEAVRRVSWTWTGGRIVSRITVSELEEKLAKHHDAQSQANRRALTDLDPDEILGRVRNRPAALRANIYLDGVKTPKMVTGTQPLLVPESAGQLPETNRPSPTPSEARSLPRSDRALEDQPLVRSMGVYRYRPEYRETAAPAE